MPTIKPLVEPTAEPTPTASVTPLTTTRIVKAGDTLWALGQRYGLTVDQLLAANPKVTDPKRILVGSSLTIPLSTLAIANATLDLPPLPESGPPSVPSDAMEGSSFYCAEGRVTFTGGYAFAPGAAPTWWHASTWIDDLLRIDVDHDSKTDVVAILRCQPGQGGFGRVVAFRPRAGGGFDTIGLVVQQSGSSANTANDIDNVFGIETAPGGQVRVSVGDYQTTYTSGPGVGLGQDRTYGWNGSRFVQTAGSTTFVVPPGTVDLAVSSSPLTYAKSASTMRTGAMTVTVRNNGPATVRRVSVRVAIEGSEAICSTPGAGSGDSCAVGTLESGTSRTVTFRHTMPTCTPGDNCPSGSLQVLVGDQQYGETRSVSFVFR